MSSQKSDNKITAIGCVIIIIGAYIGYITSQGCSPGVPPQTQHDPTQSVQIIPSQPLPQVNERDVHYDQLLRRRLEFQERIFEALDLYRVTSLRVHESRGQFRQMLGDKPVSEAIELFSQGRPSDIPQNLRAAYSRWQTLLPDETQRLQIALWIDRQQLSGILEQLDIQIREIENRRQLGRILNQEELAEIDRLLAQQVTGWETVEIADRALLEEQAIERLRVELENWE